MRVWVTRAQPGAAATAGRLRALGFEPLVAPLITVETVADDPVDLTGVVALAFTSANGVAAFSGQCPARALPVFAVGAATAEAARNVGFVQVSSADGDVDALAALIAARGPHLGAVLYPGPAEAAGDLVGALAQRGVLSRRLVVYRSVDRFPDDATAALIPTLDAVLLHAPRAARTLASWLRSHPTANLMAPNLTALCLSANVAAPLAGLALAAVRVASAPVEDALLALLESPGIRPAGAG